MPYGGQCLCGGSKVFVDGEPLFKGLAVCHCKDCRISSGTAFGCGTFVKSEYVRSEGSVKKYSFVNPAGNTVSRWFCSGCGSQLYTQSSARPEGMSVRAGNFEEFTKWPIVLEIFTRDRWQAIPPILGAMQTEDGNVNVNELLKLVAASDSPLAKPAAAE